MYFPGYNQTEYIPLIKITPGFCGYIQVYRHTSDSNYDLCWEIMPKTNNPAIECAEVIHSATLLSIDKQASICFFDLDKKTELERIELKAAQLWGAVVNESKTTGVLAYSLAKDSHVKISRLDLKSKRILETHDCLNINRLNTLTSYEGSQVIAYIPAGGSNKPDGRDGFARIDMDTGRTKQVGLSPSPGGSFPDSPVVFCPDLKIGIRPSYDNIEIKTGDEGKLYVAKIALFDLETGKTTRLIAVRDFLAEDVFEDDDPGYALSCFELSPLADEYRDVKDEFMERFEMLAYSRKDRAVWITFQHGLLRKLSLDSQEKSPLIVHPGDHSYKTSNPHHRTGFNTPLRLSPDESHLTFGSPPVTIETRNSDFESDEKFIEIRRRHCVCSGQGDSATGFMDFSWNRLDIESTERVELLQDTLEQLVQLSKEVDIIRDGHLLRFQFICRDQTVSEDSFFRMAAEHPHLRDAIKKYLKNLILFDKPLWYDGEIPAAFFAIRALILVDKAYLPILVSYLGALVDSQNEKEEPGLLIDQVIEKYGWCQDTINLILTRAYFQNERGIDQLQQYLNSPGLKQYFSENENKEYFKKHNLYLSLVEENFPMFQPNEEILFSAIESEDVGKIKDVLNLNPDFNLKHPDFDLTALELALEINNREIIDLLMTAGAEVKGEGYLTLKELIQALNETANPDEVMVQKQLDELHRRKFSLQNEISRIEYNHMLNLQLSDEQVNRLSQLNDEYKEIQTKIKYANLGLYNFDLDMENELPPRRESTNIRQKNSDDFIDGNSQFEAELKSATVYVADFEEGGQIDAFKQIDGLLDNLEELVYEETLRFGFDYFTKIFSEEEYFSSITMTPSSAALLEKTIHKLLKATDGPLWINEITPGFFHAIQCLVLFDKTFIHILITYLKSQLVDSENEPYCVSELIFDLYDRYEWCSETLGLAASRFVCQKSPNATYETRIQIKKGGLGEYLKETSHYNRFLSLLKEESRDISQVEDLIQILDKLLGSS